MKRKHKLLPLVLLLALTLFFVLPATALAAEVVSTKNDVSLTLEYVNGNEAISGAKFELYKLADINSSANLVPTEEFSSYLVNIDGTTAEEWDALSQTLLAYIRRDALTPYDSGVTDKDGVLCFPNQRSSLKPGLYLVVGSQVVKDGKTYKCSPFIVSLPTYDEEFEDWTYDIVAEPKYDVEEPSSEKTERKVLKVWEGDEGIKRPSSITVELLKDSEVFEKVLLTEENDWSHEWTELDKFNDNGTEIEWSVAETVPEDYTVLVEREKTTFVVKNTYSPSEPPSGITERTVQKVWDDDGYEKKRPNKITVYLLRNGDVFDSVVLSEETGWSYTWGELEMYDEDGEYITWSLSEQSLSAYTASVTLNGYTFVLTNSYKKPYLPRTGVVWWPVPMLAGGGLLFLTAGVLVKKRREDEE